MSLTFILILVALFWIATLHASALMTKRAQKNLGCVSFSTRESMQSGMKILSDAKIFYTTLNFNPSALACEQFGVSTQAPHEIWVRKTESDQTKTTLEIYFSVEYLGLAMRVIEKR